MTDTNLENRSLPSALRGTQAVSNWAQWTTLAVFFLFFALSIIDRLITSLLVEPIKADLRISDFQFGLLSGTAFALFFVIFSLPIGWAVDRYSRRVVVFLGVCVFSLASAAAGLARTFPQLFAARVMVGAGEASVGPASYAMLADVFPPGRLAFAIAICGIGATMGISFAYFGGGMLLGWLSAHGPQTLWLIGEVKPWQIVFFLCGLVGLVIAPLIFLVPERPRERIARSNAHAAAATADFRRFIARHRTLLVCHMLGTGLLQAALTGPITWNAAYMSRLYGWAPAKIGLWLGIEAIVVSLVGLMIHGAAVDWLFRKGIKDAHMRWCAVVAALAVPAGVAAYLMPTGATTVVVFGLFHLLLAGNGTVPPAALQIVAPRALRGKLSSLYFMATMLLGSAGGPAFVAAITDFVFADEKRLGWSLAISSAVTLSCASVLFAIASKPMRAAVTEIAQRDGLPG